MNDVIKNLKKEIYKTKLFMEDLEFPPMKTTRSSRSEYPEPQNIDLQNYTEQEKEHYKDVCLLNQVYLSSIKGLMQEINNNGLTEQKLAELIALMNEYYDSLNNWEKENINKLSEEEKELVLGELDKGLNLCENFFKKIDEMMNDTEINSLQSIQNNRETAEKEIEKELKNTDSDTEVRKKSKNTTMSSSSSGKLSFDPQKLSKKSLQRVNDIMRSIEKTAEDEQFKLGKSLLDLKITQDMIKAAAYTNPLTAVVYELYQNVFKPLKDKSDNKKKTSKEEWRKLENKLDKTNLNIKDLVKYIEARKKNKGNYLNTRDKIGNTTIFQFERYLKDEKISLEDLEVYVQMKQKKDYGFKSKKYTEKQLNELSDFLKLNDYNEDKIADYVNQRKDNEGKNIGNEFKNLETFLTKNSIQYTSLPGMIKAIKEGSEDMLETLQMGQRFPLTHLIGKKKSDFKDNKEIIDYIEDKTDYTVIKDNGDTLEVADIMKPNRPVDIIHLNECLMIDVSEIGDGIVVFMPSGFQADLTVEDDVVNVDYYTHNDTYSVDEFGNIIEDGIIKFNEPSQKIMESDNKRNIETIKKADEIQKRVPTGQKEDQSAVTYMDATGLGVNVKKEVDSLDKKTKNLEESALDEYGEGVIHINQLSMDAVDILKNLWEENPQKPDEYFITAEDFQDFIEDCKGEDHNMIETLEMELNDFNALMSGTINSLTILTGNELDEAVVSPIEYFDFTITKYTSGDFEVSYDGIDYEIHPQSSRTVDVKEAIEQFLQDEFANEIGADIIKLDNIDYDPESGFGSFTARTEINESINEISDDIVNATQQKRLSSFINSKIDGDEEELRNACKKLRKNIKLTNNRKKEQMSEISETIKELKDLLEDVELDEQNLDEISDELAQGTMEKRIQNAADARKIEKKKLNHLKHMRDRFDNLEDDVEFEDLEQAYDDKVDAEIEYEQAKNNLEVEDKKLEKNLNQMVDREFRKVKQAKKDESLNEDLDAIEVATMSITWIPWDVEDGKDEDECTFFKDNDGTFSFSSDLEAGSGYKTLSQAIKSAKEQFSKFDDEMYKKVKFKVYKEDNIDESLNEDIGGLTDITEVDLPQALADTIEVTDEGSVLTLETLYTELKAIKTELNSAIQSIKDSVAAQLESLKNEIKDAKEVEVLQNIDDKVDDLITDAEVAEEPQVEEEIEQEVEEETEEPTEETEEEKKEPELEESFKGNSIVEKFIKKGALTDIRKKKLQEDLDSAKAEIDKAKQSGKSVEDVKTIIDLNTDDDDEKKQATQYASDKLTEDTKVKNLMNRFAKTRENSAISNIKYQGK